MWLWEVSRVNLFIYIWKITKISKGVGSWFEHISISVQWEEGDHVTVSLMSLCTESQWHIRILLIRMMLQPLIKNTVNHCVMNNKEWIIWRCYWIKHMTSHLWRDIGIKITQT